MIKWIKRLFRRIRRQRTFRMYVMTVGEPSKRSGYIFPKELMQRELKERPYPFLLQFGGHAYTDYADEYPVFDVDIRDVAAYLTEFEFDGNDLYATAEFIRNKNGDTAVKLVWALGPEALQCAPYGVGIIKDSVVQDEYRLLCFKLTARMS